MSSSWDDYTDFMKESGLQICGIYDFEGKALTQAPEMKATKEEVAAVVSGISSQNFPDGIYIGGVKYTVIRLLPDTVTAKCRGAANEQENYLLHAALAQTCIVIGGICGPSERDATRLVEEVRDHLFMYNF